MQEEIWIYNKLIHTYNSSQFTNHAHMGISLTCPT
jgi:hypothetical protein